MYSEFTNINIYNNVIDVFYKNGTAFRVELIHPFDITPDVPAKFESMDSHHTVSYESKWIVIYDRRSHAYHKIYCPREVAQTIRKFSIIRNEPFELQYCKHLFWKYDKHAIDVFFSENIRNEEEVIEWLKVHIAPEHSTGTDNQPIAIVYQHKSFSFYAHIMKQNRLVANVHIPIAKGGE